MDIQELLADLDAPTAEISEANVEEVVAQFVQYAPAYDIFIDYLRSVTHPAEGDTAPAVYFPQALNGTSVYALIACPGEDILAEDVGFLHGTIRIDAPLLTEVLVEGLEFEDDLLITSDHCELAEFIFDGTAAVFANGNTGELAIRPDMDFFDGLLDFTSNFDVPNYNDLGAGRRFLFTLESGETLSMLWWPMTLTATLVGTNGSLDCVTTTQGLDCTAP